MKQLTTSHTSDPRSSRPVAPSVCARSAGLASQRLARFVALGAVVSLGAPALLVPSQAPIAGASERRPARDSQRSRGDIAWTHDLSAALATAKNDGQPILLSFGADWCPWCQRMDTETFKDARLVAATNAFHCVAIDTDSRLGQSVAARYSVESLPTLVLLNAQGQEQNRLVGFQTANDVQSALAALSAPARPTRTTQPTRLSWSSSLEAGQQEARRTGKPLLLSIGAAWCPWCRKMDTETFASPAVLAHASDFVFVQVDGDSPEGQRLGARYHVQGYPTLAFLDARGPLLDTQEGFVSGADLAAQMSRLA